MEKELNLYEVAVINGNKFYYRAILALSEENAKMKVLAANSQDVKEDTRVLVRPFC
jgi:hypothetical protein